MSNVVEIEPVSPVDDVRKQVEALGGTVGEILPIARWVQLNGVFTPEHLRTLATEIEKSWKRIKH